MRHGAGCGNAVDFVRDRAGGAVATADVGGARPEDRGVCSLRSARTELADRSSLCRTRQTSRLGGDERLVIDRHEHVGFNELCLDRPAANRHERLAGKNDRAFGDRPDVAFKVKVTQKVQKLLRKAVFAPQVGNIVLVKMQVVDIIHDLFQSRANGKAAVIRVVSVKDVEIDDFIAHAGFEIAVAHGKLIKIAEHGQVSRKIFHGVSSL